MWTMLLLTSAPIHLIFNGVIYDTNFQGSDWNLTIATEAFVVQNASYFPPGASLAPAGAPAYGYTYDSYYRYVSDDEWYDLGWAYYPSNNQSSPIAGYGHAVDMAEYWSTSSSIVQQIGHTRDNAHGWQNLSIEECFAQYQSCTPRKEYRDVLVVVDTPVSSSTSTGWVRSNVFHFDPSSNLSSLFDLHVPPDIPNSLWYATKCSTTKTINENATKCNFGWEYPGYGDCNTVLNNTTPGSIWTISYKPLGPHWVTDEEQALEINKTYKDLNVKYCLAEPLEVICKVGMSDILLLTVILFLLVKVLVCTIILWKLPHTSLITPSDAIESFIATPDSITLGLGTMDIADSHHLEYAPWKFFTELSELDYTPIITPRRWRFRPRRMLRIMSRAVWTRTYTLLILAFLILSVGLWIGVENLPADDGSAM